MDIFPLSRDVRALLVAFTAAVGFYFLKKILCRFKDADEKDAHFYRSLLGLLAHNTKNFFYLTTALYIGVWCYFRNSDWYLTAHRVFFVVLMAQVWIWIQRFVTLVFARKTNRLAAGEVSRATSFRALSFVAELVLLGLVVLFTLDNFGVNITTLVTGLGIGGIAIALAVQNILGDIFASVTIILDKPFVVGDYIVVGEDMGTIEDIGIKTTRVRSLSGEEIVFSNADLLKSRVHNFKRLYERRVSFNLSLSQDTPIDALAQVPEMIKDLIKKEPKMKIDRAHFVKFGESSFDFEIVYLVGTPDYNYYMDFQQKLNLDVLRGLEQMSVRLAQPVRVVKITNGTLAKPEVRFPTNHHRAPHA